MSRKDKFSIYLSFLLRHKPEEVGLDMDEHGWVSVEQLIEGINNGGKYTVNMERLRQIVANDNKGRYRFNDDASKIKACQGHSVPWVEPELEYMEPPEYLYHGTTTEALEKIKSSGAILRMNRHAVHMQAEPDKAWKSAVRWRLKPVVLKIEAKKFFDDGAVFGRAENDVWCTETVPLEYITEELYKI